MNKANDQIEEAPSVGSQDVEHDDDGIAPAVDDARAEGSGKTLEGLLEATRKEAAANQDRYLRSVADLENFRRRSVREREELRQFATAGLMEDLLPILDNLALGIASARQQADSDAVADGVKMVLDQLKGVLSRAGLVEIDPAPGDAFDPHQHESIAHQPSDTVEAEAILQVIRTGYSLNGRLLRAASVVLSSGAAEVPSAAE